MRQTLGIAALVFVLAACGGLTAAPTPTVESSQDVPASRPEDLNDVEYLDFTLDVSGALTQTLSGTARTAEAGGNRIISLGPLDATNHTILIVRRDTQAGEHTLGQAGDPITAQFAFGVGGEPNSSYRFNVDGTLNLTSVDPFVGSFEFTAENESGEPATATGTFNEVPMMVSLEVNEVSIPPVEVYYRTAMSAPEMAINGEENAVTLVLRFPEGAPAGEYPIIVFLSGGQGVEAIVTADGQDLPQVTGTLNLTDGGAAPGERISGTYTLTATSEDGAQTVNVNGAFENVPFIG